MLLEEPGMSFLWFLGCLWLGGQGRAYAPVARTVQTPPFGAGWRCLLPLHSGGCFCLLNNAS